ncbi:MAG TPA: AAA family ATPase, partial [Myxococcota bacterium]|nr:AAA family ATPase [Myxococcota bacterium]
MTFPRTRIQPPRPRSASVARPALESALADALRSRRVALLCAPAGYGKTTLLVQALARLPAGHAVAWVSADPGDDLQRLLECVLAALEPFDPPWRAAPATLVQRVAQGAEAQRAVAAELINALDACEVEHGVLVIDDLHRVDDPAFFHFLDRLVERMSGRWTLALASRTEPPVPLARLRAAGELAELRQLQLQFARDEARRLGRSAGLDDTLADRVFDRTQGWPAAMRIALAAVPAEGTGGRVDAGGDWSAALERALRAGERPMFEFLSTEVLDQLRPELADFLLKVSVLPELEPARCTAVSGHANAAAMLDETERLGLFGDVLDGPVRALRLHDLFRDAMQQRLALRDPGLLLESRRRAAATEPDPVRRIALLLEAGDLEAAARLAFEHIPATLVTAGPSAAVGLLG